MYTNKLPLKNSKIFKEVISSKQLENKKASGPVEFTGNSTTSLKNILL